jgi:hypothetical protein
MLEELRAGITQCASPPPPPKRHPPRQHALRREAEDDEIFEDAPDEFYDPIMATLMVPPPRPQESAKPRARRLWAWTLIAAARRGRWTRWICRPATLLTGPSSSA